MILVTLDDRQHHWCLPWWTPRCVDALVWTAIKSEPFSDLQVSVDSVAFYGWMHCNWNNCEHFSSNIYLLIILKHQPSSKLFGTVFPVKYDFSFIQRHYFPWRYFTRVVSASCPLIFVHSPSSSLIGWNFLSYIPEIYFTDSDPDAGSLLHLFSHFQTQIWAPVTREERKG